MESIVLSPLAPWEIQSKVAMLILCCDRTGAPDGLLWFVWDIWEQRGSEWQRQGAPARSQPRGRQLSPRRLCRHSYLQSCACRVANPETSWLLSRRFGLLNSFEPSSLNVTYIESFRTFFDGEFSASTKD